jgi:shikimate dehydrogenase
MQQPAFDALGLPATYERWETPAAELEARLASLRAPEMLGANVTVPHKRAVMPYLDEVSDLARRAGAVNTIINRRGVLVGDNTDIYGFATSLIEVAADAAERPALILGAGGAARGVVLALRSLGVASITLANRSADKARELASDLADGAIGVIEMSGPALGRALLDVRLLINATALGWHPGEIPLDPILLEALPEDALVADLTYRDTDLLREARGRGLPTMDGLGMLVHQGARAFELWTGRPAPVSVMLDAARQARAARA